MVIGVPKEIKQDEYRVSLVPAGVETLANGGHQVLVEVGAGLGTSIPDEEYAAHGAEIVGVAAEVWRRAQLIVKVKEPLAAESPHVRPEHVVFTFFHFAADGAL